MQLADRRERHGVNVVLGAAAGMRDKAEVDRQGRKAQHHDHRAGHQENELAALTFVQRLEDLGQREVKLAHSILMSAELFSVIESGSPPPNMLIKPPRGVISS